MGRWGERWTAEELAELWELAACGYSQAEAAAELGRTLLAVKKAGLKARKTARGRPRSVMRFYRGNAPDEQKRAKVLALIAGGCRSAAEVAAATGQAHTSARIMVARLMALGLVERTGRGRGVRLRVTSKWGASSDTRTSQGTVAGIGVHDPPGVDR